MRCLKLSRHAAVLGLSLLLVSSVRAQHTPDPYNIVGEGNLGYQDYMYSNYPNGIGYSPNQGVLQGRSGLSRANQFQSSIEELDGVGSGSDSFGSSNRIRGGIAPYYRAHRQFDEAFNRIYAPNDLADKTFRADQDARTKKYLEYLKESDPKRRAQLYREFNKESLRVARDLGSGSSRAATRANAADRSGSTTTGAGAGSQLRRPSSTPASSRSRAASLTPDASSETPEDVLNRSELMDRENRSVTPSPSSPPSPSRLPRRPPPPPLPR